jgi:hypothetical protein
MAVHSTEDRIERSLPDIYALTPIEQFPSHVLKLVRCIVDGDKAEYTEVDLTTGDFRVLVDPEPPQLHELRTARREYMNQHPVMAHFLHEDAPDARMISDFLGATEFHRLGLYGEFFRYLGVEDQLTVTISTRASGHPAGVSIDRGSRGFDEHDRKLLVRLRPHLIAARNNAIHFSEALSARSMGQYPLALSGLNFTSAQNRRRAAETPEVDKCDLSNGGFRSLNWVLTHAPS